MDLLGKRLSRLFHGTRPRRKFRTTLYLTIQIPERILDPFDWTSLAEWRYLFFFSVIDEAAHEKRTKTAVPVVTVVWTC